MIGRILSIMIPMLLIASLTEAIERRRSQFKRLWIPHCSNSLHPPGVGTGLGVIGAFNNTFDTTTDFFVVGVGGDVEGTVTGVTDIELLSETVLLDVTYVGFNKGSKNSMLSGGLIPTQTTSTLLSFKILSLRGAPDSNVLGASIGVLYFPVQHSL